MSTEEFNPVRARVASGVLFYSGEEILLVRPTYKKSWDIPGGYVEPGETPREACAREVKEELDIATDPGRLLVVDWAPQASDGEKILFVFDGGELPADSIKDIRVDGDEISEFRYLAIGKAESVLTDRLVRRLTQAFQATRDGSTRYLEQGVEA